MYGLGRAEKAPRKMLERTDKCADTVKDFLIFFAHCLRQELRSSEML